MTIMLVPITNPFSFNKYGNAKTPAPIAAYNITNIAPLREPFPNGPKDLMKKLLSSV